MSPPPTTHTHTRPEASPARPCMGFTRYPLEPMRVLALDWPPLAGRLPAQKFPSMRCRRAWRRRDFFLIAGREARGDRRSILSCLTTNNAPPGHGERGRLRQASPTDIASLRPRACRVSGKHGNISYLRRTRSTAADTIFRYQPYRQDRRLPLTSFCFCFVSLRNLHTGALLRALALHPNADKIRMTATPVRI
jgi:hypothetical protein